MPSCLKVLDLNGPNREEPNIDPLMEWALEWAPRAGQGLVARLAQLDELDVGLAPNMWIFFAFCSATVDSLSGSRTARLVIMAGEDAGFVAERWSAWGWVSKVHPKEQS